MHRRIEEIEGKKWQRIDRSSVWGESIDFGISDISRLLSRTAQYTVDIYLYLFDIYPSC